MQRPDNDLRNADSRDPTSGKVPLADYGKLTRIKKGFFRAVFQNWLDIVEGLLVLLLSLAVATHIVKATIVPEGELGFGGLIFLFPIMLLALVLGGLCLALLRGLLADALFLRTLTSIGFAAAVAIGIFGDELFPPKPPTPLHAAAEAGVILAPDPLPDAAALETRDAEGRTPLAVAVREAATRQPAPAGRMALVRQLLERGAKVNTRDSQGFTPLLYAQRHPALLDLLVAHGANPNLAYPEMGTGDPCHSMWYWISRAPPQELIAIADRFPTLAVPRGRNNRPVAGPLYDVTVLAHHPALVRYFLERGFDPNDADSKCTFGKTPLHNVVHWPEPEAREAMNLLLAAGANIDARARGETPLMIAGSRPGTVRYLIDHGADVNAMNKGRSVLDHHLAWRHEESAQLLREAGARNGEDLIAEKELMPRAGRRQDSR